MAYTFTAKAGQYSANAWLNTGVATLTKTVDIDDLLVILVAHDNDTGTTGAFSKVASVTDSKGNVYTLASEATNGGSGGLIASTAIAVWYTKVTNQLVSSDTVTVTYEPGVWFGSYGGNVYAQIVTLLEFSGGTPGSTLQLDGTATRIDENGGTGVGAIDVTGTSNQSRVTVSAHCGGGGTSYTVDSDYTTMSAGFDQGGGSYKITQYSSYRIAIETIPPTCDPATNGSRWASVMVSFIEASSGPGHRSLASLGVG